MKKCKCDYEVNRWKIKTVVYFINLLGVAHTQKLVDLLFQPVFRLLSSFNCFQMLIYDFFVKNTQKCFSYYLKLKDTQSQTLFDS